MKTVNIDRKIRLKITPSFYVIICNKSYTIKIIWHGTLQVGLTQLQDIRQVYNRIFLNRINQPQNCMAGPSESRIGFYNFLDCMQVHVLMKE